MLRLTLLVLATLVLVGCVWGRLLDWQNQLKDFDRFIEPLDDGPGLVLRFKEPCIRPADIGYLLGGDQPSRTGDRPGGGVYVTWLLKRDRPDSQGLEIALGAPDLGEKTLAESLYIPHQVLQFIPKERMLAAARALGTAAIDKGKRQAEAGIAKAEAVPLFPGRATLVAAMGEPDSTERIGDLDRYTFNFYLIQPGGGLGKITALIIDLRGDLLVHAQLKAPNFNARMRFAD